MVPKHSFTQQISSCLVSTVPEEFYKKVDEESIKLKKASQGFCFSKHGILVNGKEEPLKIDMAILATGFRGVEKLKDVFTSPAFQHCIAGSSDSIVPLYRLVLPDTQNYYVGNCQVHKFSAPCLDCTSMYHVFVEYKDLILLSLGFYKLLQIPCYSFVVWICKPCYWLPWLEMYIILELRISLPVNPLVCSDIKTYTIDVPYQEYHLP